MAVLLGGSDAVVTNLLVAAFCAMPFGSFRAGHELVSFS